MRICFTSDLHGSALLYDQLTDLLRAETPDVLILGGDLFIDGEMNDPIHSQIAYVERDFLRRVALWKALRPRLQVACTLGNHEWTCTWDALQAHHAAGRIVLLDHRRAWQHDGVTLLGYPCTPPTPHWLKDFERRDLPEEAVVPMGGVVWDRVRGQVREVTPEEHFTGCPTIAEELGPVPAVAEPWILVAHSPPHNTKLDHLPHVSYPVGSRAIRRFIEQRRPLCALHGHVHESPQLTGSYSDRLGETLCINPGQRDAQLCAVIFDAAQPAQTLRHTVYK
jgi:Icc-related predicted phosphoesterase